MAAHATVPRMRAGLFLVVTLLAASTAVANPPEARTFSLYKFQQRIGVERVLTTRSVAGTESRVVFSFTDRTSPVPLAATLRLAKDGTPLAFEAWGSTSRQTTVDDRVVVANKTLTITQRGETRTQAAPAVFFVGSAYAPVAVTEELLRYWAAHGKPARLPVYPLGEVTVERRGKDAVKDDDGHDQSLTRYALGGIVWGHETVWLDEAGHVAALKGVDAEFDHFEAVGRGFSDALPKLVARAAADGMKALLEASQAVRLDTGSGPVAYIGGRLVDGTGAPPVDDAVVVVDGDRIVAAGPRARVTVPAGARRVDIGGKTLLPGLWDMHAHFEQVEWGPLYLAAGVTTVRDCGNELDFIASVRDAVAAGKGVGPRLILACIVDGQGAGAIGKVRLRSAGEIPALIDKFRKTGCAQVKIYSSLDPRLIAPLSRAAHAAGMTVTGHVPEGIGAVAAVKAGQDQINHLQFVMRAFLAPGTDTNAALDQSAWNREIEAVDLTSPAARKKAAFFAAHKTVLDPTMALRELVSLPHDELVRNEPGLSRLPGPIAAAYASVGARPEDAAKSKVRFAKFMELLSLLHRAGVTIVAGTDQAVPGFSALREIELYVQAGFTPMEAIQAATIVPARVMKVDKQLGTVQAGKRADLIIVDGDPLTDVRALRKLVTVVAAGRAYDPAKLWRSVGFADGRAAR